MYYYPFHTSLWLTCYCFVEDFYIYVQEGHWSVIFLGGLCQGLWSESVWSHKMKGEAVPLTSLWPLDSKTVLLRLLCDKGAGGPLLISPLTVGTAFSLVSRGPWRDLGAGGREWRILFSCRASFLEHLAGWALLPELPVLAAGGSQQLSWVPSQRLVNTVVLVRLLATNGHPSNFLASSKA